MKNITNNQKNKIKKVALFAKAPITLKSIALKIFATNVV